MFDGSNPKAQLRPEHFGQTYFSNSFRHSHRFELGMKKSKTRPNLKPEKSPFSQLEVANIKSS